jgi:hypothetical protein
VNGDIERIYPQVDGKSMTVTKDNIEEYIRNEVYFNVVHGRKKKDGGIKRGILGYCEFN